MAIKYLNVRMKKWVGTAAEWQSANPVLLQGESGFESDTQYSKTGDGSTHYNDLPYDKMPGSGGSGNTVMVGVLEPDSDVWVETEVQTVGVNTLSPSGTETVLIELEG